MEMMMNKMNNKGRVKKNAKGRSKHQILNHTKLAIGITTALIGGYAGRVHAGTCTSPSPSSSVCSGAANAASDTTQLLTASSLIVTTSAGFGIDTTTTGGNAINLAVPSGGTSIEFTDVISSSITSPTADAIHANNNGTGAITITTSGVVTGGLHGISAYSYSGAVTITSNGAINGGIDAGLYSPPTAGASPINITANGAITATGYGIKAYQYGGLANNITITSNATISSSNGGGIDAYQSNNSGGGDINITSTAAITVEDTGIFAATRKGDITIESAAITSSGGGYGITAYTRAGNVTVTTNGEIQAKGSYGNGISAGVTSNTVNDHNILITVGVDITSANGDGIFALNLSSGGTVTITGNGNITGGTATGNDGIQVGASDGVYVNVNRVISGDPGINITSVNGPISVTGTGNVNANPGHGIYAYISGKGAYGDITIARDGIIDAKGAGDGIHVNNIGLGDNIITVTQAITPDTGIGIVSNTIGGKTLITLNSGADVKGGISNNAGDSRITVISGAAVSGPITLDNGSDILTFADGDFTGVTAFDGGDDSSGADSFIDELTFNGSSGAMVANANVTNWERITLDGGSSIDFSSGTTKTLGTGVLDNVGGTVNMVNNEPTDELTVTGDYEGGGNLALEAELNAGGTNDTLIINGNAVGTTIISITDLGDGSGSATVGDGILLVRVAGDSPTNAFSLAGEVRAGDYLYNLVQVGKNWYLQSQLLPLPTSPQQIPTLSEWGQILLVSLLGLFGLFGTKRRKKTNKI